jgi:hypothetical protein
MPCSFAPRIDYSFISVNPVTGVARVNNVYCIDPVVSVDPVVKLSTYTVCKTVGKHPMPNKDQLEKLKRKMLPEAWNDSNSTTHEDINEIKRLLGIDKRCYMRPLGELLMAIVVSPEFVEEGEEGFEVNLIIDGEGPMRATIPEG